MKNSFLKRYDGNKYSVQYFGGSNDSMKYQLFHDESNMVLKSDLVS